MTYSFNGGGGFDMAPSGNMGMGVMGYQGPLFPTAPGSPFTAKRNASGGFDYSFIQPGPPKYTAPAAPVVAPWNPPAPVAPWMPPGSSTASASGMPSAAAPLAGRMSATAMPSASQIPANGMAGIISSQSTGNPGLGQIIGGIASTPFVPTPAPDFGITDPALSNIINYNQYLANQANQANDTRFRQAAAALGTEGNSAQQDIQQNADNEKAIMGQNLINNGLSNTTVGATLGMGIDNQALRQQQYANDQQVQQLVNLLASKTDQSPNNSLLSQYLSTAANKPNAAALAGLTPQQIAALPPSLLAALGYTTGTSATPAKPAAPHFF